MITFIGSLIVTIVVVFAISYNKKKKEEEMYQKLTYSPENAIPYPRGFGEIIVDYQYALFDQFVRSTWPCNFLSWECKLERLTHRYEGNHLIVVRHTDGTYHEECIKVSTDESGDGDTSIGAIYKFEVLSKTPQEPTEAPKTPKPEDDEKPKKPEPSDDDKKSLSERAAEWFEKHKEWLNKEAAEKGYIVVKEGEGENTYAADLADELYKILDNLFQVQMEDDGIGISPLPEY